MPLQLYKDSMAFHFLRLHGYQVSTGSNAYDICFFRLYIKTNLF